jgi:hypothetical protein
MDKSSGGGVAAIGREQLILSGTQLGTGDVEKGLGRRKDSGYI